jgi:predicted enzyme related to lactoylglutathione lyase
LAAAALVGGLALLPGQPALADVSLNAGRIGAQNVPAVAKFYEDAFGLKEVNRINVPGGNVEIMLNFGDTAQAAKANPNAQVVIMHRPSDDIKDPVPHLIFNVSDLTATAAAVQAAGGMMQGKPRPFGHTGMLIGFAVDPAGNRLELIQQPRRGAGQE